MEARDLRKGMRIMVPKGTLVHSARTGVSEISKRSQPVTVAHIFAAEVHLLAHRYHYTDGESEVIFQGSSREKIRVCETLGLPCGTDEQIRASLESLVPGARVVPQPRGGQPFSPAWLYIDLKPAKVAWAGGGQYWRYAPASAVVPYEGCLRTVKAASSGNRKGAGK